MIVFFFFFFFLFFLSLTRHVSLVGLSRAGVGTLPNRAGLSMVMSTYQTNPHALSGLVRSVLVSRPRKSPSLSSLSLSRSRAPTWELTISFFLPPPLDGIQYQFIGHG